MRLDRQTKSKHYFNTYAVKDRVDLSQYSSFHDKPISDQIDATDILPSTSDECSLKKNFSVLVARILVDNIAVFKKFDGVVDKHIEHKYSAEMYTKSDIVSVHTPIIYGQLHSIHHSKVITKIPYS